MNRLVITLSQHGEIEQIAADAPLEIFFNCPSCPQDRVYQYASGRFWPEHVRAAIGGFAVGHAGDGVLGAGDGTGRRAPSRPRLTVVPSAGPKEDGR